MKLIRKILIYILIILLLAIVGLGIYGYKFYKDTITKVPLSTRIEEIRNDYTFVGKNDLPREYLDAVVAVEDRRFYNHGPIDIIGIGRAIFSNLKNKRLGEGGSTITQQVAKNIYFIEERNVVKRKLGEIFIAIDLEKNYEKDDILEIYANTIYFGDGYYGIKEACNGYLKKEPKDMNLAESTMLAGVPNAPSVYAPTENKELCKQRQRKVISSMVEEKCISQETADGIDQSFIDNIE